MAVRSARATEREITEGEKEGKIGSASTIKQQLQKKMTWESTPHASHSVCVECVFRGKKDCNTYNYRLSFCLLTLMAKWRTYIVSYCLKNKRGGEKKRENERGLGVPAMQFQLPLGVAWSLVTQGVCCRSHMVQMDHINLLQKQYTPPTHHHHHHFSLLHIFHLLSPFFLHLHFIIMQYKKKKLIHSLTPLLILCSFSSTA